MATNYQEVFKLFTNSHEEVITREGKPENEFVEEKMILDGTALENGDFTIENLPTREESLSILEENGNLDPEEIDNQKRKIIVDRMLSKDYNPIPIVVRRLNPTPFSSESELPKEVWQSFVSKLSRIKRKPKSGDKPQNVPKRFCLEKKQIHIETIEIDEDSESSSESRTNIISSVTESFNINTKVGRERAQRLHNLDSIPGTLEECIKLFEDIYNSAERLPPLPSPAWGFHRLENKGKKSIVFTELGMFDDQDVIPQVRKLISFNEKMVAQFYVFGKLVITNSGQNQLYSEKHKFKQSLENLLQLIDSYNICKGGTSNPKYANVKTTRAVKGLNNKWRAKRCRIMNAQNTMDVCNFCADLENIFEHYLDLME